MSAKKNIEFELMPHDPDVVDKLAWRSDLKVALPTPIFSAEVFTSHLLRQAATGVRWAESWTVPSSELLIAKFIFDVQEEDREAALKKAVCLTLGGIAATARIRAQEVRFTEFGITWMYDSQMFAVEPQNALAEIPAIHAAEIPHHPIAA